MIDADGRQLVDGMHTRAVYNLNEEIITTEWKNDEEIKNWVELKNGLKIVLKRLKIGSS